MEQNLSEQHNVPASDSVTTSACPVCHQPILPQYYFCPNCGAKIKSTPLSTTLATQVWIYLFSIILPMIAFLFVTRWPGVKYYKSQDPKAKQIGQIAWTLLVLSTLLTIWLVVVWTQNYIQATVNSLNTDMSSFGT
jgi:hypothetical protein